MLSNQILFYIDFNLFYFGCTLCYFSMYCYGDSCHLYLQVNEFLAGAGTDAPDVEEIATRPSGTYDDMWAKTILESDEAEVI